MTPQKRETLLEICFEQVERIHADLMGDRNFNAAEKARGIMKGLIDLSNMLEDKQEWD